MKKVLLIILLLCFIGCDEEPDYVVFVGDGTDNIGIGTPIDPNAPRVITGDDSIPIGYYFDANGALVPYSSERGDLDTSCIDFYADSVDTNAIEIVTFGQAFDAIDYTTAGGLDVVIGDSNPIGTLIDINDYYCDYHIAIDDPCDDIGNTVKITMSEPYQKPYIHKNPNNNHWICSKHGDMDKDDGGNAVSFTMTRISINGVTYCQECYWKTQVELINQYITGVKEND